MAWLAALDPARRNRLAGAVLLSIVAAVGLSVWASQETFVPVVSGRGYDSALTAAAAVDQAGIQYRLVSPDILEVPQSQLGAARAAISADSDVDQVSAVDSFSPGLTPRAQEWAFLRAAETNIARMLNGMDGIVGSRVTIVPREQSLYLNEQRPASASVFLKLRPGVTLQEGQVRAIVSLVANSVDGLAADRVSVADDRGALLAAGDGGTTEGPLGASRSLVEYQGQVEGRYERAVAQALLPVLGYGGGFSVTATADLDLTSTETTTRQMDTTKQAVVSEQVEENNQQGAPKQSGVPGVDANLPESGSPNATTSVPGSSSARTANTVNYDYPTVNEVATRPAGGLKRLSVAVQVDQARVAQLVEGSKGSLDETAVKAQIDKAVQAAVGFDAKRGDQVTVSYLPFAPTEWTEGTDPGLVPATVVRDTAPYMAMTLAVVLIFWFVVRPIVGVVVRPVDPEAARPAELALAGGPVDESDENLALRLKSLVDNFQPIDHGDLNRLVDRESETAADVLRKWSRVRAKGA